MKESIKTFVKQNIPSRYIELLTQKGISLTKIPKQKAVISDLFILRIEDGWETNFECLQFHSLLDTGVDQLSRSIHLIFYDQKGKRIGEKDVRINYSLKTTLSINQIAIELDIQKDGLFAVFHTYKENWLTKHNSFLAERGYIGYANQKLGTIKSFVHGNLDAIAKFHSEGGLQLLGNYSFLKKEYNLQHNLTAGNTYQIYLVNPTNKTQKILILEKSDKEQKIISVSIPSAGSYKHVKSVENYEMETRIIIKSKLYLARPVVFKIMPASFDVFHG